MNAESILRLAAWAVCVAAALQVFFFFVFQLIGYDSYLLSGALIFSLTIALLLIVAWKILKKTIH